MPSMGFLDIVTADRKYFSLLEIPLVNNNSLCLKLQGYQAA